MKKLLATLVLTVALFTLAACGGGTNDGTQGVTDDTIKIGNTAATSGGFAGVGVPFNHAIEAYIQRVNDDGGINGRMIEFIHYDDEFNEELGISYTQELVEEDKVFALVGHFGTPTVGATRDYLNGIGIPRVYYATGVRALFNPDAEGNERSSFPVQPIFDAEGEVIVARAYDEYDVDTIGVIYTNDDAGLGILNGAEIRAEALGIDLVTRQVDAGEIDYSAAANALVGNDDVDVVIAAANQEPAKIMIQALHTAGNTKPVFTSYVSADATFIEDVSEEIASEQFPLYANAWIDIMDPEGEMGFSDEYWDFAGAVDEEWSANAYAMAGWIAAHFFVEGLRRVGEDELTWTSYIDALEESPVNIPFGGVVNYENGSRVGTQAMALLKAEVTIVDEDETYNWNNVRPIQDISEIIGN